MPVRKVRKLQVKRQKALRKAQWDGSLRKGDPVMVVSGGNKKKRPTKGQVGKISGFSGELSDRVCRDEPDGAVNAQKKKCASEKVRREVTVPVRARVNH